MKRREKIFEVKKYNDFFFLNHMKKEKVKKLPKKDIKLFIDFFYDASIRIRGLRPVITRGKDGALIARALQKLTRSQLEMLCLWFLSKKKKLSPTIGAMLSLVVLDELVCAMKRPMFWRELDEISEHFVLQKKSVTTYSRALENPFSLYEVRDLKKYLSKPK